MNTGLISSRYATTLLEFSIENGEQDVVYQKMKLLTEVFIFTPLLRRTQSDRSINILDKKKFIITACGGSLPVSLDKMIDLILKNDRQDVLHFIALQYIEMYRKRFKIQNTRLTTAYSMEQKEMGGGIGSGRRKVFFKRLTISGQQEGFEIIEPLFRPQRVAFKVILQ